jgi:hypothetical protein
MGADKSKRRRCTTDEMTSIILSRRYRAIQLLYDWIMWRFFRIPVAIIVCGMCSLGYLVILISNGESLLEYIHIQHFDDQNRMSYPGCGEECDAIADIQTHIDCRAIMEGDNTSISLAKEYLK